MFGKNEKYKRIMIFDLDALLSLFFLKTEVEYICECVDTIDSVGYGNCTVEYEGEVGCYVIDEPKKKESNCTDLTESEKGQYSISEACRNRGKLLWLI